jgi:hypothetical protein
LWAPHQNTGRLLSAPTARQASTLISRLSPPVPSRVSAKGSPGTNTDFRYG